MKRNVMISFGVAVATMLLATGCGTLGKKTAVVPPPVGLAPNPVAVRLDVPDAPVEMVPVQDRTDLNEVVRFGLALSDAGKHDEAARVFLKASSDFRSKGRMLEQDLTKAAICEHWLAGDLESVRSDFEHLEKHRQDLYDSFNEDDTVRRIREIVSQME